MFAYHCKYNDSSDYFQAGSQSDLLKLSVVKHEVCVCARARVYDLWKMNLSRQLVLRMAQHTSLTMHTLFHYLTQQHSLTSLELGCSDTVKLL